MGLSLAAENGTHCVVSGPLRLVRSLERRLGERGIRTERLSTSHAFHSGLMEPALEALREAAPAANGALALPLVSDVTGRVPGTGEELEAGYWVRQARSPVRFGTAVRALSELGVGALVEVGPRPVLGPLAALAWPESEGTAPTVLSSLTEGADGAFPRAVGGAYEAGLPVSFAGLFAGERRRRVALPTYPFQRERHWAPAARRRAPPVHPLLGERRELPSGEVSFEVETTDLDWLPDHRVFDRVVAPGALYGLQALAALATEARRPEVRLVDSLRIETPLVLQEKGSGEADAGRTLHLALARDKDTVRAFEVFSRGASEKEWVRHAAGTVRTGMPSPTPAGPSAAAIERLQAGAAPVEGAEIRHRLEAAGIRYGPAFRRLTRLWSGNGEALGELEAPEGRRAEADPGLLDGCFQLLAGLTEPEDGGAWLPVGWERLWLEGSLPPRLWCHARQVEANAEVRRADLGLYAPDGTPIGGVEGFAAKRASRSALAAAWAEDRDLLYRVEWREAHESGLRPAAFLKDPADTEVRDFGEFLAAEGLDGARLGGLTAGLDELARSCARVALTELGGSGSQAEGAAVETLRRELGVVEEHRRLFGRVLRIAADESPGGPPEELFEQLGERYPEGAVELGLLRRCGAALAEVLRGRAEGLELLFSGEPSAADLYREAPGYRALNALAGEAVGLVASALPEGRRLRVLEVGAGAGGTTAALLPALPAGRTDYVFTDISAGFFGEAERRFGGREAGIEYRTLDIERDPQEQGFAAHRHDLVVAANVLHATRDLGSSLRHCRRLLAPSGVLVLVEGVEARAWLDLTFGMLPGWWRFADAYREEHPLVPPAVWRRALSESGFGGAAVLGPAAGGAVMLARGPSEVEASAGLFVLAEGAAFGDELGEELRRRGRTVLRGPAGGDREAWRSFLASVPEDIPLRGVVHLGALSSRGEPKEDIQGTLSGALGLTQGLRDAGAAPTSGLWFVTRGGQVLDGERDGALFGSALWGFGRTAARELADLPVRMLDLDPGTEAPAGRLAEELLFPDGESEVLYRGGERRTPRLVRLPAGTGAPDDGAWRFAPDPGGAFDSLPVERLARETPGAGEVRVAVEAAGLNFHDVLVAMGVVDPDAALGGELCGRVLEAGPGVRGIGVGDRVLGFAAGTFGPEAVTRAEVVVAAPRGGPRRRWRRCRRPS